MTEIALELAQRAQPDHLREIAMDKAEDLKVMAKDKAHEKLDRMKGRARETVMTRTSELTDQFAASRSRPYIGAAVGAGLGYLLFRKLFGKRAARVQARRIPYVASGAFVAEEPLGTESYTEDFYGVDEPSYGATEASYGAGGSYGMDGAGGGTGDQAGGKRSHAREMARQKVSHATERVSSAVHSARAKASGVAHTLGERGHQLRERVPPAALIKQSGQQWYASHVQEQPLLFALGAVGLGLLASALVPISSRERQLASPAKQKLMQPALAKAEAAVEALGSKAEQKLSGMGRQQQEKSSDGQTSASIITSENDPMAKDEFGMGIPDPQSFPSH